MKKYRMLPVIVEAIQWLGVTSDTKALSGWISLNGAKNQFDVHDGKVYLLVNDKEVEIELGDYIVKGQNGKFYSCKPHIFWKTYEEIKEKEYHEI